VSFEFRRQGQVWLEHSGVYYRLHTEQDVTFSQTFKQGELKKRTLHSLNTLFNGSTIIESNPANFSFVLFMLDEVSTHQHKPLDLLLNYNGNSLSTFNLYFVYPDYSPQVYYKIETAVFTGGTFQIPRNGIMRVELTGEGSKLTRTEGAFPGTDSNYDSSPTFALSRDFTVTVGSDSLDNILGASLELQNNIDWTKNTTVQKSLSTTDSTNTTYPESFVLTGRKLGGSIRQYVSRSVDTSTSNLQTWQQNVTVRIQAGLASDNYQLDVNMVDACSFTNRASFAEVFAQNYDYRLMTSPSDLNLYFTY
jgi:hypothetical protein